MFIFRSQNVTIFIKLVQIRIQIDNLLELVLSKMVYSQAKVIAGGLAHIPIVIGVFYFIMTFFNKRALEFAEANKSKKPEAKVVDSKNDAKPVTVLNAEAPKAEAPKEEKK